MERLINLKLNLENDNSSKKLVRECIMYIEELVDKLQLGNGDIKGNFSKGRNKLIYHDNPEDRWYKLCIPEISFRSVKDAKYCGFKQP